MRIRFLGTWAGFEPTVGVRHVSFVIEEGDRSYWFDAGEMCSHSGSVAGVNMMAVRAIFISHCHIDHIGGLPNLMWGLGKMSGRAAKRGQQSLAGETVKVLIPQMDAWDGVMGILNATRNKYTPNFEVEVGSYADGVIYDNDGFVVRALHNTHLGEPVEDGGWQSFSFRIEAGGKSVVYSGDVKSAAEIRELVEGCDLFLMETGHHRAEDVCRYLDEAGVGFGRLGFIHHGRAMAADRAGELRKAQDILGDKVFLTADGMVLEV